MPSFQESIKKLNYWKIEDLKVIVRSKYNAYVTPIDRLSIL
jgi:hypothetical protein